MSLDRTGLTFDEWVEEGAVHLNQFMRAATFAPSDALAVKGSNRVAALRKLVAQHLSAINFCTSPLLRLPRELHEHILIDAATGEHVREWMKLGQICSSLRDVLLGLHHLWGNAVCSWPDGRHRDELFKRAGPTAPLRLYVASRQGASDATQFAMDHLEQARVITASYSAFVESFVQNTGVPSLPYLEEITLDCSESNPVVALNQPPRETPRLEMVRLSNVLWNFIPSTTLAMLKIECSETTRAHSPSQFLDLLRHCGCLQYLYLDNCLPYVSDDMMSQTTVSLPHLRQLTVVDNREYALQLWRALSVIRDAKVDFTFRCDAQTHTLHPDYDGPPVFQDTALFKHHLEGRQPVTFTTTDDNYTGLSFIVSSTTKSNGAEDTTHPDHSEPKETLALAYDECFQGYRDASDLGDRYGVALRRVCAELGLSDSIERLVWFANISRDDVAYWTTILQDFANLQYLDCKFFTHSLCAALGSSSNPISTTAGGSSGTSSSSLLLPALRELKVGYTRLIAEEEDEPVMPSTTGFLGMLRTRSDEGHPFDVLKFAHLHVGSSDDFLIESSDEDETRVVFLDKLHSQFPNCSVEIL